MPIKKKVALNTVKFGRFGEEPQTLRVKAGATVANVLEAAGVEIGAKEKVWVNGSRATFTTKVTAGDIVAVVSPKEAGR